MLARSPRWQRHHVPRQGDIAAPRVPRPARHTRAISGPCQGTQPSPGPKPPLGLRPKPGRAGRSWGGKPDLGVRPLPNKRQEAVWRQSRAGLGLNGVAQAGCGSDRGGGAAPREEKGSKRTRPGTRTPQTPPAAQGKAGGCQTHPVPPSQGQRGHKPSPRSRHPRRRRNGTPPKPPSLLLAPFKGVLRPGEPRCRAGPSV